jgi:hypothetical protein
VYISIEWSDAQKGVVQERHGFLPPWAQPALICGPFFGTEPLHRTYQVTGYWLK